MKVVLLVVVKHSNSKVTYTVSYDKEGRLAELCAK